MATLAEHRLRFENGDSHEQPLQKGMPERLRRLERIEVEHPIFFVTTCTARRREILANEEIHNALINFSRNAESHRIYVGRYVIMPDHLHLFVHFSTPVIELSTWMKSLKNSLSKTLRQAGVPAPHWQKVFLIVFYEVVSFIPKSGTTWLTTPSARALLLIGNSGRGKERCIRFGFEMGDL